MRPWGAYTWLLDMARRAHIAAVSEFLRLRNTFWIPLIKWSARSPVVGLSVDKEVGQNRPQRMESQSPKLGC